MDIDIEERIWAMTNNLVIRAQWNADGAPEIALFYMSDNGEIPLSDGIKQLVDDCLAVRGSEQNE